MSQQHSPPSSGTTTGTEANVQAIVDRLFCARQKAAIDKQQKQQDDNSAAAAAAAVVTDDNAEAEANAELSEIRQRVGRAAQGLRRNKQIPEEDIQEIKRARELPDDEDEDNQSIVSSASTVVASQLTAATAADDDDNAMLVDMPVARKPVPPPAPTKKPAAKPRARRSKAAASIAAAAAAAVDPTHGTRTATTVISQLCDDFGFELGKSESNGVATTATAASSSSATPKHDESHDTMDANFLRFRSVKSFDKTSTGNAQLTFVDSGCMNVHNMRTFFNQMRHYTEKSAQEQKRLDALEIANAGRGNASAAAAAGTPNDELPSVSNNNNTAASQAKRRALSQQKAPSSDSAAAAAGDEKPLDDSTHKTPFMHSLLGSLLQTDAITQQTPVEACANTLGVPMHSDRTAQVEEAHRRAFQLIEQNQADAFASSLRYAQTTRGARVMEVAEYDVNTLLEQAIEPFNTLPPCGVGTGCVAVSQLRPHDEFAPPSERPALKAWQSPDNFHHYLATGILRKGDEHNPCVACLISMTARAVVNTRTHGVPAQNVVFPFLVSKHCPGGFAERALLKCNGIPGSFPAFRTTDWLPIVRTVTASHYDASANKMVPYVKQVRGYDLRPRCKFIHHTTVHTGSEELVAPREYALSDVELAHFNEVLVAEVLGSSGVRRVIDDATLPHHYVMSRMLTMLLKPFQQSLATLRASNAFADERLTALIAAFDNQTNGFSCGALLHRARARENYSVLYTVAIRVALSSLLLDEPAFALANNQNLRRFQQVHQPLLEWFTIQLVHNRGGDNNNSATNRDSSILPLALSDRFVVAAARDTPAERERHSLAELDERKHHQVGATVEDDEMLHCALELLELAPGDDSLRPYFTAAQLRQVRYRVTPVRYASSAELLVTRYYRSPSRSSLLYDRTPSSPSHAVLNQQRANTLEALQLASLTLEQVLVDDIAVTVRALELATQSVCANDPARIRHWLVNCVKPLCDNFDHWKPSFVDELLTRDSALVLPAYSECKKNYVARRSESLYHLLALLVRVNVLTRLLSIEERAHSVEHRQYIAELAEMNDPYIRSPPVQHRTRANSNTASTTSNTPQAMASARAAAAAAAVSVGSSGASATPLDDNTTDDDSSMASDNSAYSQQYSAAQPQQPMDAMRRRVLAALGSNNPQAQSELCAELLKNEQHGSLQQTLHNTLETTLPEGLLSSDPAKRPTRAALQQALPRSRPIGTPHTPYREAAYRLACVLFSHLRMADEAAKAEDAATDAWFLAEVEPGVLRVNRCEPDERYIYSEDNALDISDYIQHIDLVHGNDEDDDSEPAGIDTFADAALEWVYKIRAMVPIACQIRDVKSKFPSTMADQNYALWTLSNTMRSLLGLYRHAAEKHAPFARALMLHQRLEPRRVASDAAATQECANWLLAHENVLLEIQRESVFYQISLCPAYQAMLDTVWVHFDYVYSLWTPAIMTFVRNGLYENTPLLDIAQQVDDTFYDRESRPTVFRRLRDHFTRHVMNIMRRTETKRRTNAIIEQAQHHTDGDPARTPLLPHSVMLNVSRYICNTPPSSPTLALEWFAACGMSPRGVLCVYELNALYAARASRTAMCEVTQRMNRVDFTMCWLIMHILHQHRARVMFALPRAVAEQQTLAVRERSKLPDTSVDLPETCHKVAVCHILGCQKIVSYSCPTHTRKTIGHRFGSYNAVYKALACQHKNGSRMQAPLNRRVRDDDAINAAMSYNHAQLALAALTPEQIAANPERYRKDRAAADEWLKRVTAAVKKHVRAEMRVAFATPCNAQPCENYPLIGGVLHSLRQKEKETHYYTTICPRCGVFTTYSSDRVESNGFSCGNCQYTNRLLVNAARCICCGAREYIRLPMLSGEQAAQKARDKKDASRAAKKAKRLAAKELAKAGANAAQTNDTPLEQADELVQTAFHALADRSKLQPHVQPALGNAAATSTDSALPANGQEKRASKRTYDAISSRNANATMKIIERSEVSFHRYVAYDDRPVVGTHTFIEVLLCGNCDRLDPLVRDYGLSLNEFMRLTKDVSPVDGYFANEHSVLDDILENRSLAVLAAATPVTTVAQRKAATAASRRRKPRTPRAPKTTAAAAAAADGTVAKKPRKKRQAKRKQADLDDDVSSSVGSATTTTDTEITTDLLFGDVDDDDDDDAVAAAAVNTATAATVNNEEDDEEDEEAGFMAVLDSIAFND